MNRSVDAILKNIELLAEDYDLEAKLALGQARTGELPRSFWETYSAMANTRGGYVFLGVEEKPKGTFKVRGIPDPERVLRQLRDGVNDRDLISHNLLTDSLVDRRPVEGGEVIVVTLLPATRREKPVYVGKNPLEGTFRRNYEGDRKCDSHTVRRMLADQVEDERDGRVFEHFSIEDLDPSTLLAYRSLMIATKPDHVWNELNNRELLRCLGAWSRDRERGVEGMTLGGLLMFGRLPSILEIAPDYVLDYQEREESKEVRWIDRLTTDGSWSGNLFDFYRLTIKKLTADIKIPFRLKGTGRSDDTPVHEALREALVNSIIHADYSGRRSILIVKRPGLFGFRNPGLMRISYLEAIEGG